MVFTLIATAALCGLVQFPVAETIYIYFIAPLGTLAMLAVVGYQAGAARAPFLVGIAFYLVFSVAWINRSIHLGVPRPPHVPDDQTELLDLDRSGGIRVRARDKQQYEALVKVVRTLATGEYIFATPDCPEVYFLSGFRNPTRTTYDFFDDPTRRAERIRDTLARAHVGVVVLNWRPQYSGPPPAELVTHLREDYPKAVMVGAFEVRWRP